MATEEATVVTNGATCENDGTPIHENFALETKEQEKEEVEDKKGKQNESSSEGCVLHVSNLTRSDFDTSLPHIVNRNVKNEHLEEIFGHFGSLKNVELRVDPKLKISKGFAYVEYNTPSDAENAQIHMDGGQLDGNVLKVSFVLVNHRRRRSDSEEKGNNFFYLDFSSVVDTPAKRLEEERGLRETNEARGRDAHGPGPDREMNRGRDVPRERLNQNERRDFRGGRSRSPVRSGRGSFRGGDGRGRGAGRGGEGRGASGRGRRFSPPRREPRRSLSPDRRRRNISRSRSPYRSRRSPSPVRRRAGSRGRDRPRSPIDRPPRQRNRSHSRSSSSRSSSSYTSSSRSRSSSRSSRSSRSSSYSSRSRSAGRRRGRPENNRR
jgi:RNA-binding protein with serine-rich domain 1